MAELELTSLLRDHAARHSVPGGAVAVLRDGEVTTGYSGVADTTTGEPITSDTRFAIGSVTKPIVATVIVLVDANNPDNPTVTFDAFDHEGRSQVIYLMLWGLPRV